MNDFAVSEFFRFHPLVNFAYYTAVIIFSMIFMNPVFIAISVTAGVYIRLFGKERGDKKVIRRNSVYDFNGGDKRRI